MREETVVVPNERAEEFDTMAQTMFTNVDWECESNDFNSTFTVWNVFTSEAADAEVGAFVDAADYFQ